MDYRLDKQTDEAISIIGTLRDTINELESTIEEKDAKIEELHDKIADMESWL